MSSNQTRLISCNWITLILIIMLVLMTIYPSRLIAFSYITVTLFFSLKYPVMGVVGWIMGYPYFNIFTDATGIIGYLVLSPLIVVTFISQLLKKVVISIPVKVMIFILLLITNAALSLLFTSSPETSIISFGMLLMAVFIIIVLINVIKSNPKNLGIINQAYVAAVIAIFISTLLTDNLFGAGRLSIGESIRRVANVTSPALIILFIDIIMRVSKNKNTLLNTRMPILLTILLFFVSVVILVSTVSRGAIMAVVISGFLVLFFNTVLNKNKGNPLSRISIYMVGFSLVVWAIGFVENNIAGKYLSRMHISNFGGNLRWHIWQGAIEQMDSYEYFIGAGPNVFRELAILSGYDYYAHSVFVDTFVTLGIIGLLLLSTFIISILLKTIKNRNIYSFGMIVLVTWLYATHGNLTGSLDFWTLLGITFASLRIQDLSIRQVKSDNRTNL